MSSRQKGLMMLLKVLQERYVNSVCLLGPLFSKHIKKIQSKVLVTKDILLKLQAEGFHLH